MGRIVLSKVESKLVLVAGRDRDQLTAQAQQRFAEDVQPIVDGRVTKGEIPENARVNLASIDKGKDKGLVELTWPDEPKAASGPATRPAKPQGVTKGRRRR